MSQHAVPAPPRAGSVVRLILQAMLDSREGVTGYDLLARTGCPTGSVYPALKRLESCSLNLVVCQEVGVGRRVAKSYALTAQGVQFAEELLARCR